jgi:hypothetical protein
MPAAENTNNFWNLGGENRGLPQVVPTGPGFYPQIAQILKEEGSDAHEKHRMHRIWRTRADVSQTLPSATLASLSSLPRRSPAMAGPRGIGGYPSSSC